MLSVWLLGGRQENYSKSGLKQPLDHAGMVSLLHSTASFHVI
jgi:hypothetical protein